MNDAAPPALPFRWDGEGFFPVARNWALIADKYFVVGEVYRLEVREERSAASHNHYFASVVEAHQNLPEKLAQRFPTPDHLRRFALIKAGFREERSVVCASPAEAQKVAGFIKPMDDYAVVMVRDSVVIVYTAKSQSVRAMGKDEFQKSKDAVLEVLATIIGTTRDSLIKNAGGSA